MIGKVLAAIILVALAAGSVSLVALVPSLTPAANGVIILVSALSGGGFVFLLNLIGIGFRPKYFGSLGIVISGLILAYGIYALATMKTPFLPMNRKFVPVVGGATTGVGAVGVMTSAGILTM